MRILKKRIKKGVLPHVAKTWGRTPLSKALASPPLAKQMRNVCKVLQSLCQKYQAVLSRLAL
jgi:hypothetical protein